jgi:hypothetical protein
MKVVCAWCGASLPDKQPLADAETTHVICPACARRSPWAQHIAAAMARRALLAPGTTAMTPTVPEVPDVATTPHAVPTRERDALITRPEADLPSVLDPAGPRARGYPADPKPVPKTGQGDPDATDPAPDDVGLSA